MSKDLAQLIEQKVKHEVSQAKKEINGKLSSFKDQVNVLEGKVNSMEQSYASVVKQPSVNDEKKLNIVIKDCVKRISETVNRIENELSSNRCINEAYGSFTNFLMNEMDLAGLTVTSPIKYECKSKQSKAKTFLKPCWSDLLQQKWDAASKNEKLWLKCSDHTNIKRKLKQEYCAARNDFDKHLRKAKRTYQNKLQMDLMTELEKPNSRDFWKQIGKIGISNDRRDQIPWEVIDDNGEVTTDKERVLQKWKTDYQTLFNDQTDSMLYDECHLDRIKKGEISSDPEHVDTSCLNEPITRCEVEKAVKGQISCQLDIDIDVLVQKSFRVRDKTNKKKCKRPVPDITGINFAHLGEKLKQMECSKVMSAEYGNCLNGGIQLHVAFI
ncbi:unnamed protein product [Mytilus edulis]|uniref:Uncharacterized protein n=1 Tax=Mytilus edulis TaxID=6550 RepID=A0A8S3SXE7_MYTED|nr:unnamed protein product [Mytilus edulis]